MVPTTFGCINLAIITAAVFAGAVVFFKKVDEAFEKRRNGEDDEY